MPKHIVIVLQQCGGRSIGLNAVTRAKYFSKFNRVTVVSDSFPDEFPDCVHKVIVTPRTFNYLRRYCHVPNDFSFAMAARRAVKKLHDESPVTFVLCHSYSLAWFVGHYMEKKYSTNSGMFMHGHIFSRPKGTYDSRIRSYYGWLAPKCYGSTNLIFALSNDQKNLAIRAGANESRVVVCPNGIDNSDIGITDGMVRSRFSSGNPKGALNILFVGRSGPEKGLDILIKACRLLNESGVEFRLKVICADAINPKVSEQISRGNLDQVAILEGPVKRAELGRYYMDADILCVPSIDEPFGNVVIEGMLAGCLVIGSETGGICDIIEDGITGILTTRGSANALARKLIECDDNWKSCEIIAAQGARSVRKNYGWDGVLEKMQYEIDRSF